MRTATASRQSVSQATVSQTVTPRSTEKSQKVAASQQTDHAPLRLTRRGRVVLTGLTALLITGLGIGAGTAHAASGRDVTRVTVSKGQNLWSVAEKADPDTDPRAIIAEVISLNGLTSTTIYPGERLWVPRE
jgi:LysM repeat protein